MRLVTAALFLSMTAAAPAPPPPQPPILAPPPPIWNPKAPENRQLLPAFTLAALTPVLDAIGARYQRSDAGPGRPGLLATFRNGRTAQLSLSGCEKDGGCKALIIQSFWKQNTAVPPSRTAQALETFNQRYAFAKAYVTLDGRPSLQRYLTADFGFLRGDLAVNLLNFADQAERLAIEYIAPLGKTGK